MWWLIAGTLALVIGVFPEVLSWAADLVGIEIPTNLVFFVSLFVLFLVCIQHSAELTKLEDKVRVLAEKAALNELRVSSLERALEEGAADVHDRPTGTSQHGRVDSAE